MSHSHNNIGHSSPEHVGPLPEIHDMVGEMSRIISDNGAQEYILGDQRFVGYPVDEVFIPEESGTEKSTATILPVLPYVGSDNESAYFKMPSDSMTLKSALLENQLSDNSEPLVAVIEVLGKIVRSLEPHHTPRGLGLGRVLIDKKTGNIKFLPTVRYEETHNDTPDTTLRKIGTELSGLMHGKKRTAKIKIFQTALGRYATKEQ